MTHEKQSLKTVREEVVPNRGVEGLVDGGHLYVHCSSCRAALLDVFRTRPHEPHRWKLKANCPFCGDVSFIVEVVGGFHIGGIALSPDDEPDEDRAVSTIVESSDINDDTFIFVVQKASSDARPVYRLRAA